MKLKFADGAIAVYHNGKEHVKDFEPTSQTRGIPLLFSQRVDDLLVSLKGNPAMVLNNLILEFATTAGTKPSFPTLDQIRSRAQVLNVHAGASFSTYANLKAWDQQHRVPCLEDYESLDPNRTFSIGFAHNEHKGTVVILSTKHCMENFRQEVLQNLLTCKTLPLQHFLIFVARM